MRTAVLIFAAFAVLGWNAGAASAADDCGYGWKREKHRCVPYDERKSQRYHRYYDDGPPPRYYRGGYDGGVPRGGPYERPIRGRCVSGFTVQDGICKPYRGG